MESQLALLGALSYITPMANVLLMAMALRKGSFNKKFIRNAQRILNAEKLPHQFELLNFEDYPMPVYDGDIESSKGIPDSVTVLGKKIAEADALIFSTPEYNGGMSGPFKNCVDWVSRIKPMPWSGKQLLLLGASPGALGATRSLWHSRVPLEAIGVHVFPDMMGLPKANEAFDDQDKLKDAATEERLKRLLLKFVAYAL